MTVSLYLCHIVKAGDWAVSFQAFLHALFFSYGAAMIQPNEQSPQSGAVVPPGLPHDFAVNNSFVPLDTQSRWTVTLLIAVLVLHTVTLSFTFWVLYQRNLVRGDDAAVESVERFTRYVVTIGLIDFAVFIISAITFLIWFHRAYDNLSYLRSPKLLTTPGWAVGSWFIPIFNLIRPFQVMREIAVYSSPNYRGKASASDIGAPEIIKSWWGTWIIAAVLERIASRLVRVGSDEALAAANIVNVLVAIAAIAAGLMAMLIVRKITSDQNRRYEKLAAETG